MRCSTPSSKHAVRRRDGRRGRRELRRLRGQLADRPHAIASRRPSATTASSTSSRWPLATEELWFTEREFGGLPWDADGARAVREVLAAPVRRQRSRRRRWSSPTSSTSACRSIRDCSSSRRCGRNGVPSEALVFPDEGHWVLKALNSKLWHESVFGWMKKYL